MKVDLPERTKFFALRIIKLCQYLNNESWITRTLGNQLLKAGTSIGANVAEGEGYQSQADFLTKYSIAVKEAHETKYWLDLIIMAELVEETNIKDLT